MPESRPQNTPVVVDGIMYVTGWNELQALDATTGRALWSYREPRHPGIVSEAGIGVNRGATILGDRVFMTTDHATCWDSTALPGSVYGQRRWVRISSRTARRRRRCPSAICSSSASPAVRRARADFSMRTARRPASACGASTRFRSAARKDLKPGSGRRSSMDAARHGCPARTILNSI